MSAQGVMAAEIKVLSAGAVEPGLKAAATAFQKASNHQVAITFNTAPQIRKRLESGEVHDVVLAPPAVIDEFAKAGKLGQERANVGRVGLGAAVRPGAPALPLFAARANRRPRVERPCPAFPLRAVIPPARDLHARADR